MGAKRKTKKHRKTPIGPKLDIGFADALLEWAAELKFPETQRREFLLGMAELWVRVNRNKKLMIEYIHYFGAEAHNEGVDAYDLGKYVQERRLKSGELPSLEDL